MGLSQCSTRACECVSPVTLSHSTMSILTEGSCLTYRRVTIRIATSVAVQVNDLVKALGWQRADFLRTLLCIGATILILSHENEASREAATTLLSGLKLIRLSRSFSLNPRIGGRPYAFRTRFRNSTLITLSLPNSLADLVAAYASLVHASRNQAYSKSIQQGLLIYLKTQATTFAAATGSSIS